MANEVLYEVAEKVAVITLNRPEKRNALNAAMRQGLWDTWRRFEADDTARVAILAGAGDKAFCAGVDLTEMSVDRRGVPPANFMPDLGRNIEITKPTIAAGTRAIQTEPVARRTTSASQPATNTMTNSATHGSEALTPISRSDMWRTFIR